MSSFGYYWAISTANSLRYLWKMAFLQPGWVKVNESATTWSQSNLKKYKNNRWSCPKKFIVKELPVEPLPSWLVAAESVTVGSEAPADPDQAGNTAASKAPLGKWQNKKNQNIRGSKEKLSERYASPAPAAINPHLPRNHWVTTPPLTAGSNSTSLRALSHCCACLLSCVGPFATPWTAAHQAPLPMGLSRQEYWSGLPFPSPGHLPDPGIELEFPVSPPWVGGFPPLPPLNSQTLNLSFPGVSRNNSSQHHFFDAERLRTPFRSLGDIQ